jgi:lipopolysaccharide transport system ATP-binding protein
MQSVISVENLFKKYIIGHQKRERYTSLRDVLVNGAKHTMGKLFHPFAEKEIDETHEDFWALKDVSFDIQQGERVGIIGRNGAGKSTLLKILSRITEPTAGRVKIRGRVASLLEVGTGFHPELTGRENIYLNGAVLGMSKAEIKRKFDEIVDFAEVEKFLDTPVKRYSSGMYARLAFAVAAHLEPEILIVDEVLAVGDAKFQKKCLGKMEQVGQEGRTVLFVSHNMAAIRTLCTNLIWLDQGKLVDQGRAHNIIDRYLSDGISSNSQHIWVKDDANSSHSGVIVQSVKVTAIDDYSGHFTVNSALSIEFNYELTLDNTLFYIGFHFKTLYGDLAFVSSSSPQVLSKGLHKSVCKIPANLLNTGIYSIHVYFVRNGNDVLLEMENPIVFEIHDIDREEGAWTGEIPGALRPKLNWATTNESGVV